MISYTLHCEEAHEFEGWFSSSSDFDHQQKTGLLSCPFCASPNVQKSLMAPAVSTSRKKEAVKIPLPLPGSDSPLSPHESDGDKGPALVPPPPLPAEIVEQVREFKRHVMARSEDVGERFPEEARKIHYGETDKKAIVGKASLKEAAELSEEGISILPLPTLPDEAN